MCVEYGKQGVTRKRHKIPYVQQNVCVKGGTMEKLYLNSKLGQKPVKILNSLA